MAGAVFAGLAGTILPAFGYLPALGASHLSMDPFSRLFAMPGLLQSVTLSFATGLAASLLSLIVVLLFAAGWSGTRTFQRISRFLSPLLSVPHAAASIGLAFLVAPSGFLVRLVSPWATGWDRPPDLLIINDPFGLALILGLTAKEVPFLFLMIIAALNRPDIKNYAKIGASLGYGRMATFFKLILPQTYPLIRLPVLAVVAYSTSVVDVALILGPTTPAPLAPRLLVWMNDPDLSLRLVASAGALVQLGISGAAIVFYLALEVLVTRVARIRLSAGQRLSNDRAARVAALLPMILLIIAMGLSLLVLVLWTFAKSWWYPAILPQAWTFSLLETAFAQTPGILVKTLSLGLLVSIFSTGLVLWQIEAVTHAGQQAGSWFQGLVFVPLLLPQIGFLFGLKVLFLTVGLDGSFAAVLLAHMVFVLPYAYLALKDPWQRLDPRYARLAASLGASRARIFFKIQLPLLLRPILVTFAVALAVSVGQYLPTVLIGAGRVVTVTTESVALASGGNRSFAALYALLQLCIPLAGFAIAAILPSVAFKSRTAMRLES